MPKDIVESQEQVAQSEQTLTHAEKIRLGVREGRALLKKVHREVSRIGQPPDLRARRIIVIVNEPAHPQSEKDS